MQITMSMEEYEDFKRNYEDEIYRLEKELAKLRREFDNMSRKNAELLLKGKDAISDCGKPPKSQREGGFLF